MVCLHKTCNLNCFKGCLPQILFGPFLTLLSQSPVLDLVSVCHKPTNKTSKQELVQTFRMKELFSECIR